MFEKDAADNNNTPSVFEVDTVCYCSDYIIKNRLETDVRLVTVARAAKLHEQR